MRTLRWCLFFSLLSLNIEGLLIHKVAQVSLTVGMVLVGSESDLTGENEFTVTLYIIIIFPYRLICIKRHCKQRELLYNQRYKLR